jgi:tetratricopeptide (TPR) repeat protein
VASKKGILLVGFLAASALLAKFEAAEYYYENGNFPLALALWEPVLKKNPRDPKSLQRVGELTLLLRGRSAMIELFTVALAAGGPLDNRNKSLGVFWELQSRFLTDRAQELYMQAFQKRSRKDFAGASGLLRQAASLEPGHALVLRSLAQNQWDQGDYDGYFTSLKAAWKSYPFDSHQRVQLAEAFLHFRQYGAAVSLLKGAGATLGERGLLALAVGLFETGEYAEAKPIALSLVAKALHPTDLSVAHSLLGQLSFRAEGPSLQTSNLYSQFLSLYAEPQLFDPFHIKDRVTEAQRYAQKAVEGATSIKGTPGR